jgi:hypothetical protein
LVDVDGAAVDEAFVVGIDSLGKIPGLGGLERGVAAGHGRSAPR